MAAEPAVTKTICEYNRINPHINLFHYGSHMDPNGSVAKGIRRACDRQFPSTKKTLVQRLSASVRRKKETIYDSLNIRTFVDAYRLYIYVDGIPSHYTFERTTHPIEDVAYMVFLHGYNIDADQKMVYKTKRKTYDSNYMSRLSYNIEDSDAIPYEWNEEFVSLGRQFQNEPESHLVKNYKQTPPANEECQAYRSNPEQDPRHRVTFVNENDREYVRDKCVDLYPVDGIIFQGRQYTNDAVENELYQHGLSGATENTPFVEYAFRVYDYQWVMRSFGRGQDERERNAYLATAKSKSKSSATRSYTPRSVSSAQETLPDSDHTCTVLFRDVLDSDTTRPYKSLVRKMTKRCTEVIDKCDVQDIRKKIAGKLNESVPGTLDSIYIEMPAHALQETFKGKLLTFAKLMYVPRIRYTGQAGIGAGVFKDYLTKCLNEAKKLFAPIHVASERYAVHPDMSPAYAAKLGYGDELTDADVCRLYELVGGLFAYCARADIPLPFYFSRMILAKMLYSRIPTDMSILYYILEEDNVTRSSILSLFKEPQNIEYVSMQMNDMFPLVDAAHNADVTDENYISYLDMYSRHMYWKQLKITKATGKSTMLVPGNDTSKYLDAFIRGFHICKTLRKEKIHVRHLDDMLSSMHISYETIMQWLTEKRENIRVIYNDTVYTHDTMQPSPGDIRKQQVIFMWFMEILNSGGTDLPLAYIQKEAPKFEFKTRKTAFVEFFKKLMSFWSSLPHINFTTVYTVVFKYAAGHPTSATCFNMINLPQNINSKDELYKMLIYSVFNVVGFDLA
jgi:hypothetical protein